MKKAATNTNQNSETRKSPFVSDEFVSGIDGKQVDERGGKSTLSHSRTKKRKKLVDDLNGLRGLPNVVIEGGAGKAVTSTSLERNALTKPRSNPPPSRADQKPENVSAALSVIGVLDENNQNDKLHTHAEENQDEFHAEKTNEYFSSRTFEDISLNKSVCYHLSTRMDMKLPTKVQERVLDTMLNLDDGQLSIDVLVRSATGSGKTLAYLLPIAHYMLNRRRRLSREDGAMGILIVPTRELADQVHDVASLLFRPWHWIVIGSVVGGESKKREKARLRKGINILVGTPGRLLDHMRNTKSFRFQSCEFLVLDEADRLLDLGFEAEVKEIIERLDRGAEHQKIRSNILLSATLRKDVDKLAHFSLRDPVEVSVNLRTGDSGPSFAMPTLLKQHFCIVEQRHRLVTLACFLRLRALKDVGLDSEDEITPSCKIIVFFSTCDSVDFHYGLFKRLQLPKELQSPISERISEKSFVPLAIHRIHGNHAQTDRTETLRKFRSSNRAVLLCTDVAARGLDLKGLTFAIQYDPPTGGQGEELEYLHRAGRTARIGARGDALLFLLPSERAYVGKLESTGVSITEISSSAAMASLYPKVNLRSQDSISYATRFVTSVVQENLESVVHGDERMKQLAIAGFQAYCRAYATHARDVRYFFHVRNLHLGHVARAFTLSDKPIEFSEIMKEVRKGKSKGETDVHERSHLASNKGDVARAIASGERQPFNDQTTALARRRREKGRGTEAMKELAMEFLA
ncbi:putative ATP-dependent RNA helicase DDX31 [Gracilariopsis chorda]|uniref:ATP-dependent RNA helicase n=1 Tax=Gracilariopsis chorda TaxID=448386 RepID=A0A2V3J268_9FLOR|nr:putative ATP-dependent RNA helicase DDX31 [Gracilariopsis chorda]|eukprot:PXF48192.1 putative ATP-dependent RNA helicase DDX31 [Gracilariopsis chorda]